MPQLTFPLAADGWCVDVRINRNNAMLAALQAAGRPLPTSIPAKGLIDTGSDVSAVAPSIIQQLALPVHSQRTTQGIGGSHPIRLFKITLFILDVGQPHLPWLSHPDLLVMELPSPLPVEVLIGQDILLGYKVLLDGPGRQLTLDHGATATTQAAWRLSSAGTFSVPRTKYDDLPWLSK